MVEVLSQSGTSFRIATPRLHAIKHSDNMTTKTVPCIGRHTHESNIPIPLYTWGWWHGRSLKIYVPLDGIHREVLSSYCPCVALLRCPSYGFNCPSCCKQTLTIPIHPSSYGVHEQVMQGTQRRGNPIAGVRPTARCRESETRMRGLFGFRQQPWSRDRGRDVQTR